MVEISTRFGFSRLIRGTQAILILLGTFYVAIQSLSPFTTNLVVSTSIPTGVKKGDAFSKDLKCSYRSSLTISFRVLWLLTVDTGIDAPSPSSHH